MVLDSGVDGSGACGSRTLGGTVVPLSTGTRRATRGDVTCVLGGEPPLGLAVFAGFGAGAAVARGAAGSGAAAGGAAGGGAAAGGAVTGGAVAGGAEAG